MFLDFGKNFEQERKFYDEPYLSPREEKHLLSLGILPGIKGIYKKNMEKANIDGVIVSHPHLDHMDYIRYIKDHIPIYCGIEAKDIIITREFSGKGASSKEYYIANFTSKEKQIFKNFITFKSGQKVTIKDVNIEAWAVDHSIPGAYGYIIQTQDTTLVYTGDFRFHGPRGHLSKRFIQNAAGKGCEIMIIEGTNISGAKPATEEEIEEKITGILTHTTGLVLAGFSPADIDRLNTFYKVARKTGRKLVISMKQAFMIHNLSSYPDLALFNLSSSDVYILGKEKKTRAAWEKEIIERWEDKIKEAKDLQAEQREVILVASFYDMREIMDIHPVAGSIYLLSQSEPFNEEMEIDYGKLLNWLDWYGLPVYHLHASGHADPHQLKQTVAYLAPEYVFLVHTERPHLYRKYLEDLPVRKVICPVVRKTYRIGKRRIKERRVLI